MYNEGGEQMLPSVKDLNEQGIRLDDWLEQQHLVRELFNYLKENQPEEYEKIERGFEEKFYKNRSAPEQK